LQDAKVLQGAGEASLLNNADPFSGPFQPCIARGQEAAAREVTLPERLSIFIFLVGLGFKLGDLHLQGRRSTTWSMPLVHFALVILKTGSAELFLQAGLELQAS
jgi:hypothetical protein